jgi:hypothetical protein
MSLLSISVFIACYTGLKLAMSAYDNYRQMKQGIRIQWDREERHIRNQKEMAEIFGSRLKPSVSSH